MSQVSKEKFYSLRQLAKRLQSEGIPISERTLYRLIKRKVITPDYTTVGYKRVGMYYFSEEKVKRIIETIKQNNVIKMEGDLKDKSIEDIIREEQAIVKEKREAINKAYEAFRKKILSIESKERIEKLKARYKQIKEIKDVKERIKALADFSSSFPDYIKSIKDFSIKLEAEIFFKRMLNE